MIWHSNRASRGLSGSSDPDGRPLAGARVKFQPLVTNLSGPQRTAEFRWKPSVAHEVRRLVAFHEDLKLAGSSTFGLRAKGSRN